MLHKTLDSYYTGTPYDEDQEHPDGPLWIINSARDWDMVPSGVYLEHIATGHRVVYDTNVKEVYGVYGLRGYRD